MGWRERAQDRSSRSGQARGAFDGMKLGLDGYRKNIWRNKDLVYTDRARPGKEGREREKRRHQRNGKSRFLGNQRPAHLTARPGQSLCHRGGDLLLRGWILPRRFERLGRGLLLGPPLAVGLPIVRVVSPEPHERSTRRLRGLLSQREEREAEGGGGKRRAGRSGQSGGRSGASENGLSPTWTLRYGFEREMSMVLVLLVG